ncbi:MAG: response regulator [Ekhidna sp.]
MRILIVDDSTYIRSTIKDTLKENGFEVIGEAGKGEEAIDLAMDLNPDVITLDNMLPDMTGIDVLKTLKGNNHSAKIIMISAVGQESSIEDAKANGALHYLVKPFDHNQLVIILNQLNQ